MSDDSDLKTHTERHVYIGREKERVESDFLTGLNHLRKNKFSNDLSRKLYQTDLFLFSTLALSEFGRLGIW